MSILKLNILLGKTDAKASQFKAMLKDFGKFFSTKQGVFKGIKRTYQANEGTVDDPSKRGVTLIQSTVAEKLKWFRENSEEYINALFSQEATNASGNAVAELIVEGESWGEFTSLELLRLKGILEGGDFVGMLETIPVYSDATIWEKNDGDTYKDRIVMQSELLKGMNNTITKEHYILEDPNVGKLKSGEAYTPQIGAKDTTVELGNYTMQEYTGEISQRERANILQRRNTLHTAVIETMKKCNECEVVESGMTSDKIFGFIFDEPTGKTESKS